MTKVRRRYDREFKISIVAELESGKSLAQIAREYGIHPSLPSRWRDELAENPEIIIQIRVSSTLPKIMLVLSKSTASG